MCAYTDLPVAVFAGDETLTEQQAAAEPAALTASAEGDSVLFIA